MDRASWRWAVNPWEWLNHLSRDRHAESPEVYTLVVLLLGHAAGKLAANRDTSIAFMTMDQYHFFGYLVVNVSMKRKGVTEMLMFDLQPLGFDQLRGERQLQDWEQHVGMRKTRSIKGV